jgi:AcrR family transcriptional regulator
LSTTRSDYDESVPSTERRYHHGNLRAELLAHAELTLARSGVDGLSLRELARELGVSHGAPRQHFRDRQSLLDALAERGFDRLGDELRAVMQGLEGDFGSRLVVFAQAYVQFASRQPALVDLMFASLHRPGADVRLRDANDRAFATPISLIAGAWASREIVADDPDQVAMSVLAVLQGLVALVTTGLIGDRPVDDVVAGTVETLVVGLLPRP